MKERYLLQIHVCIVSMLVCIGVIL